MDTQQKIDDLRRKIEDLARQQNQFQTHINTLHGEIRALKQEVDAEKVETHVEEMPVRIPILQVVEVEGTPIVIENPIMEPIKPPSFDPKLGNNNRRTPKTPQLPSDIEKFIGENLSNKIGIIITVLGIGIGVKYAIDHNLISPLARIILGYLMGFGLFGASVKLRTNYKDLSAVILSGALATFYFVTYAGYEFYQLIPQAVAFAVMVVVTVFTVVAALSYDLQIIAIGGLIGAYCVPFLLSNNQGHPEILFSYMLLINGGILYIAFIKDWKLTNYLAFGLSWLIFLSWFVSGYGSEYFTIGLTFVSLFFILFYAVFLAYKFIRNQMFSPSSVAVLLFNSLLFYSIGYTILDGHETGKHLLGLFTLGNAVVHFMVSVAIYRRDLADRNLFFLVSGLVLSFITLAVTVQLEGHWVTTFWACEMALLFWIGRTKQVPAYEIGSYCVMILTGFSLFNDIQIGYNQYVLETPSSRVVPIFNVYFLTVLIVIIAYWFIRKTDNDTRFTSALNEKNPLRNQFKPLLTAFLVLLVYILFFNEIDTYFDQAFTDSYHPLNIEGDFVQNDTILSLKSVWLINYTLFFVFILNFINLKKYRNNGYIKAGSVLALGALVLFLCVGLYESGTIKNAYLYKPHSEFFTYPLSSSALRYVSFALVGAILYILNENRKLFSDYSNVNKLFDLVFHATLLWIISSEMVHWLELYESEKTYKIALSILFGVYALILVVIGIKKKKKHLRLAAIGLFGFTLFKLFLYDLANLETIAKTIVMVSLGVLLLVISFLYNKYKEPLSEDDKA